MMLRRIPAVLQHPLNLQRIPYLVDVSLLIVRVGLAWTFIYHGAGTLFDAFNGPGVHGQAVFFSTYAHLHPGTFWAVVNGITEFGGGIAIAVGVFARLSAIGLFIDMVTAMITVTFANGFVSRAPGSGYELNVILACLALVIVFQGPGRLSLGGWLLRLLPVAREEREMVPLDAS
jgi:putative oxidoreductase